MEQETLDKINKLTRRPLTEDEVYVFSVVLCDNEIDRDGERFSDKALEELKDRFVGKTGIFDHNAAAVNQNARIFETELVTDDSRITKNGEPYKYLKASAYMVRTDENKNLIAEIDGGIKKEVSISCSAAKRICSICGCDKNEAACSHVKGKSYGDKQCCTILSDITDAYEWSFVAVPAQINAGVTKKYFASSNASESDKNFEGWISPEEASVLHETIKGNEATIADLTAKNKEYEISTAKMKIAYETGLPFELSERLSGDTEDEIRKDAEKLARYTSSGKESPRFNAESAVKSTENAEYMDMLEKLRG